MVDIVEGRTGSLLYQALTPGIDASYILSLLFADFQAQGDFFLISDTGAIASADEALDAGRYYAVRRGKFELEMKKDRGVSVLRTEVDVGDIYDQAREDGMEGEWEWLGLAEQRLFAVQEQGLALYQALHLHCTSLLSAYSTLSHWFSLARSLLLHISPFLERCQACAKAFLHQISLCPAPDYVDSFVQQLKTEGDTRPLGKWLVEAGLDKRYSHIYRRTEVKLKNVLLSLEDKEKKVAETQELLETAWSTTQGLLLPSLQAAETLPKALLWLRTVVSAYSSLRDAIEEDTISELQKASVSCQIATLEGELQSWKDTAGRVEAGDALAGADSRLPKFVRRAADVATELTTRLKVQFLSKETALIAQIGKLKELSRYFDRDVLANLAVQLESEVHRREEYEARVKALWGQLQREAQTEQQLRTAFVSSVGSYIPANCHVLPADSPTVAAVHSLAVSFNPEKPPNDANGGGSRLRERELMAELETARKALSRERVQKRLLESNLADLAAESRLLLSSALTQSQDLLKREVSKLGDRQEAYLKDLQNQVSTLKLS